MGFFDFLKPELCQPKQPEKPADCGETIVNPRSICRHPGCSSKASKSLETYSGWTASFRVYCEIHKEVYKVANLLPKFTNYNRGYYITCQLNGAAGIDVYVRKSGEEGIGELIYQTLQDIPGGCVQRFPFDKTQFEEFVIDLGAIWQQRVTAEEERKVKFETVIVEHTIGV